MYKITKTFIPEKDFQSLKPCPFCGSAQVCYSEYESKVGLRWKVTCTRCMAEIDPGYAQNLYVVRELWNHRT